MRSLVILDTHVLHWWSAEPDRLSAAATHAVERAERLAVAAISWSELAWLVHHERVLITVPLRTWLQNLSQDVETLAITPSIAATAVELPRSFPSDPADRLIFAAAIESGATLVTKDRRMRKHPHPTPITVW